MKKKKILILNYGAGNTAALKFALKRLKVEVILGNSKTALEESDALIIPGVGAAGKAMQAIEALDIIDEIRSYKKPVLGICLGMQLLCSFSEEGNSNTMGIFPDSIRRINSMVKVPHLGWNKVYFEANPLFNDIKSGSYFYFVHSYYLEQSKFAIGHTEYDQSFVSVVQKANFYGCQFHPEKSAAMGEQFLQNFINL